MLATDTSNTQRETADIELGGRRFPAHWLEPKTKGASRLRQLAPPPNHDQLPAAVAKEILSRLSWAQLSADVSEVQPLVEAYVASLNQLAQFRQEVDLLLRAACEANLDFRQESGETHAAARDAALQSERDDMLRQAACDWFPPRNVLDAKLVSRPVPEVRRRLDQAITEAVAEFTKQLFALFAKLVDHELFGLVEWMPNNCCAYHFFKRVVIQENDGASHAVNEVRFDRATQRDPVTGRRHIGRRTTRIAQGEGRHTHRLARHQHDVMNAIRTSIDNSRVVMPPPVERLCRAVPDWLKPFVEVIDGTIFRERIIERDVRVANWEDVQVIDEPIVGYEPGVILGSYVLTGWGPREVEAELRRRATLTQEHESAQQAASATLRYPIATAGSALLAIVTVALMFRAMNGVGSGWIVLLTAALALGLAWQAAFDFATVRRDALVIPWANLLTFSLGCQFAVVLWLIARLYYPLHWATPLTLVALVISAQWFLSRLTVSNHK
jgi:hypothetical protein